MKTAWDYTTLAQAYLKRPQYAESAIREMLSRADVKEDMLACDIGAGTGHLTLLLLERGIRVVAVEPNDAMRVLGISVTEKKNVEWVEGVAESTGLERATFDIVTFGSSFNTTDRKEALIEVHRILKPGGWFACMWNHRDLTDKVQSEVESIIQRMVPEYQHGSRREDQTPIIEQSGLFHEVSFIEGSYVATIPKVDYLEAWRSHATLQRQSGDKFDEIIKQIGLLISNTDLLKVPYVTRLWMAQRLS